MYIKSTVMYFIQSGKILGNLIITLIGFVKFTRCKFSDHEIILSMTFSPHLITGGPDLIGRLTRVMEDNEPSLVAARADR